MRRAYYYENEAGEKPFFHRRKSLPILKKRLEKAPKIKYTDLMKFTGLTDGAPLSGYTSLRVGGPAAHLFEARSEEEVIGAIAAANEGGLDWRVIGFGTNILASDRGTKKAIIVFRDGKVHPKVVDRTYIEVNASFPLSSLVEFACASGLGCIEDLAGIPGSVGGAVAGNAGAYGKTIGDSVASVRVCGRDGRLRDLSHDEMNFSYRSSRIKSSGEAILGVRLKARPCDPSSLKGIALKRLADRKEKHPDYHVIPTAGSFFKNPGCPDGTRVAAGRLLEDAGCKGLRVGNATTWHRHANIIITDGPSSSAEISELASEMKKRVGQKFSIALEPEVYYLE
jgi:UDP-N-acetylmuramate dehydrogenase